MRGDLMGGFVKLAGSFPPSINSDDDVTKLKDYESPLCYGVSCGHNYLLKSGTCPTGTTQNVITKSIGSVNPRTWYWFYNRLWRSNGTTLFYGPPEYDDIVFQTGVGKITLDGAIVTFLPALQSSIWVATQVGSQILEHTTGNREWAEVKKLYQEFSVPAANQALVLNGLPVVSNSNGVFSFDGTNIKEWTRPIRYNLDGFTNKPILADYAKGWIIGTGSFVIDTQSEKLFDYTQVGSQFASVFTSRTLAQTDGYAPFEVQSVVFMVQHLNGVDGSIQWSTNLEEDGWVQQPAVFCPYEQDGLTRIEVPFDLGKRVGHRFALRIENLDSEMGIREIQLGIRGLAAGSFSA